MAALINSDFETYLRNHTAKKGEQYTHTRIGDTKLNIYAGSYNIPLEEENEFLKKYYKYVFVNGHKEYLTEKQNIESGPIVVDIDLRYDNTVSTKQHTEDHIIDAVMLYAEKIQDLLILTPGAVMDVFVMEKNDVNKLKEETKDGIHIIFGIQMHKALQVILRERVMPELSELWSELPITNTWDQVLDEGISKGYVNWQLYGSRKPGHQSYMIKNHYT